MRVVDRAAVQVYATVPDPDSPSFVELPFSSLTESMPDEPGVMGTLFSVLPELPESTRAVDVSLLFGVTVPDVPVSDGLLEPTADRTGVVPLGTGWPDVPAEAVRRVEDPELSVYVDLDLTVDGRGEAEPFGDNASPEGQQANPRVTIIYTREEG